MNMLSVQQIFKPFVKNLCPALIFATGFLTALQANAESIDTADADKSAVVSSVAYEACNDSHSGPESLFPGKTQSLAFSHFTWGAEVGSSLDLTSHDLSTFDVDVNLGFKNSFIKMAGIGAGIHRSIHTGNNFVPIYALLRTSFRSQPSLFFFNLQAGYSFNTIKGNDTMGDFTGSLGIGINLQQTRMAKSYLLLCAAYQYYSRDNKLAVGIDTNYIFFARLMLGVNF